MAKLLVADDDDSLVSMLVMNIKQVGYTVDVAYNFSSAVELLSDTSFDLLILDVDLPDGSERPYARRHLHLIDLSCRSI